MYQFRDSRPSEMVGVGLYIHQLVGSLLALGEALDDDVGMLENRLITAIYQPIICHQPEAKKSKAMVGEY